MSNIIFADLEWLIDIPYWYSVSTIWTFDGIEKQNLRQNSMLSHFVWIARFSSMSLGQIKLIAIVN